MGKWKQWQTLFSWALKSLQIVSAVMKLKDICSLEEKLWQAWIAYSKAETSLCQQSLYSQSYGFSRGHVRLWVLDCKEGQALKNWCFWIVVLEKTLESSLDSKEIQQVHLEGNQSWIFTGMTDAEAENPILWPPDGKWWFIGKDADAGRNWRQEEKRVTEDEMVGWNHLLEGHEFGQFLGNSEGQESQSCCCPWGDKESDMTEKQQSLMKLFPWLHRSYPEHAFLFYLVPSSIIMISHTTASYQNGLISSFIIMGLFTTLFIWLTSSIL